MEEKKIIIKISICLTETLQNAAIDVKFTDTANRRESCVKDLTSVNRKGNNETVSATRSSAPFMKRTEKRWRKGGWFCFDIQIFIVRKDGLKSLCKTQIILLLLTASFHPKYPSTFPHMQRHWNEHEFLRSHSLGATVETLRKRSRVYQKKLNVINTKKSRRGGFFWTQCVLLLESDHVNLRLIWIYELCVSLDRSGFLSSMHLFTLTIWQVAFGFFAPPIGRNITCDTLAPTS